MTKQSWTTEERELIMWILNYINGRTITRNDKFYTALVDEITLGPDSPRARSSELQDGLRLMKTLIKQSNKVQDLK